MVPGFGTRKVLDKCSAVRDSFVSIAARRGEVMRPLLMRSVGHAPLKPGSTERSSEGLLSSAFSGWTGRGRIRVFRVLILSLSLDLGFAELTAVSS